MQRWYCVFVVLMKMDATVYNTVTLCNGRIVTLAWDIQRTKTVDDIPSLEDWCNLMKPTWEAIMPLNELAAHIRSSTRVKSTSFMSMETGLCTHTRARLGSIRRAPTREASAVQWGESNPPDNLRRTWQASVQCGSNHLQSPNLSHSHMMISSLKTLPETP
jgi:hypothetical protein